MTCATYASSGVGCVALCLRVLFRLVYKDEVIFALAAAEAKPQYSFFPSSQLRTVCCTDLTVLYNVSTVSIL